MVDLLRGYDSRRARERLTYGADVATAVWDAGQLTSIKPSLGPERADTEYRWWKDEGEPG